jgi:CRP/FNR family transcriptional regulator
LNIAREVISNHPVFAEVDQNTLRDVINSGVHKSLDMDETLVGQGECWSCLFLVIDGEIHALKESQEGRVLIVTTIQPGEIFWGLAFFAESDGMPVMLQANYDSKIVIWQREFLLPVIMRNSSMSWNICQIMIKRMQNASEIVEELAFQPVMSRLASLLLDVFGGTEGEFVSRELTLDDMAAHIGTTREMVCRHLYRFAERGAIDIRRTELKLNDRDLLEEQASKV